MKIYILGCGALGSNLAMNLAFDARNYDLVLWDFDKVEARNYDFGTQQYLREQLNLPKTNALSLLVYRATGKLPVGINKKITDLNFHDFSEEPDSLVVDCLDNYEARHIVLETCKIQQVSCLHVGFSPKFTFEISWNENYTVPDDMKGSFDICQMPGARSFVQYVSGVASDVIVDYLATGKKRDFVGNKYSVKECL